MPPERMEPPEESADAPTEGPAAPGATGAHTPKRRLRLFTTANTDGKLAQPRCRHPESIGPKELYFAHQVGMYLQQVAEAERQGAPAPIALHLGDSAFPGSMGRYLLSRGEKGANTLVSLLGQIPWEAHALGNQELGLPRETVDAFAAAAETQKLPLQAANLQCTGDHDGPLCRTLRAGGPDGAGDEPPYRIVERDGLKVGIVSVVEPALRHVISRQRAERLDFLGPEESVKRAIAAMKEAGPPDLVVVQYHATTTTETGTAVKLAESTDAIDILLTNQSLQGHQHRGDNGYLYMVTPGSQTYVVGTGKGPMQAGITQVGLERVGGDWTIDWMHSRVVSTADHPLHEPTAAALRAAAEEFCEAWGDSVAPAMPLAHPFDRSDFVTWMLNVMRFSSRAEIALSNSGAIMNGENFPIPDRLTFADIHTILPYANPMVLVRLKGEHLASLSGKLDGSAVAVGLQTDADGNLKVNGRALQADRDYWVATNRYVANGGDGLLDPSAFQKRRVWESDWSRTPPTIGELLIHWAQSGRAATFGPLENRLSPTENFPDLYRRLLWTFSGSLNASYDRVTVHNPTQNGESAYDQSQLNVNSTDQINAEGDFSASADSRNHGWDNRLKLQYATARVQNGEEPSFEETKDLIRGRSRYKYVGFRANSGGKWWVPMPTAELQVETEFNPALDAEGRRTRRKLELTGILGATFRLVDPLELKIGADVRRDVNNLDGQTVFGLAAAYQLERIDLAKLLGSPIKFESEVEYFYNAIGDENLQELRSTSRLYYSVFGELSFTATFSAFLFRSAAVGEFGTNTELVLGLNYLWEQSLQTF